MDDREPRVIDCLSLARRGLWDTARCCRSCHEADCCDGLELDLGDGGDAGSVRLHLCCAAGAAQCGAPMARASAVTSSTERMRPEMLFATAG